MAAKWLVDFGEGDCAAYMLGDFGLKGIDLKDLEEQGREALMKINGSYGLNFKI